VHTALNNNLDTDTLINLLNYNNIGGLRTIENKNETNNNL